MHTRTWPTFTLTCCDLVVSLVPRISDLPVSAVLPFFSISRLPPRAQAIADTTKRLEIVGHLVAAFRAILATTPSDLLPAVYLCVNRVAPAHMGVELGVGEATLIKVGPGIGAWGRTLRFV